MDITEYIIDCINNNIPISFSKYGDGEYNCICNINGMNCDGDKYTNKLSQYLISSFKYMVENANNSYIGLWDNDNVKKNLDMLVTKKVNWCKYHTIILDKNNDNTKARLFKTIKDCKKKKIIVCNNYLIKSKILLNIDEIVLVSLNNWFDNNFENILKQITDLINEDGNHIVITCCGMGAKVLICELVKKFPNGIYLDFGSALDIICTKHDTRGWNYGYSYYENLLKECLPNNWDDNKFNILYDYAKKNLGLHLK